MKKEDIMPGKFYKSNHGTIVMATCQVSYGGDSFRGVDICSGEFRSHWDVIFFEPCTFKEAFPEQVREILSEEANRVRVEYLEPASKKFEELQADRDYWVKESEHYSEMARKRLEINEKLYQELHILRGADKGLPELSDQEKITQLKESNSKLESKMELAIQEIGSLKEFILHLQDYISAKHLESEGLIFEKFKEESK